MAFIPKKGRWKRIQLPVTPSTALSANSLVTQTSGLLVAATDGTTAANILGIVEKAIASTDSDYASSRTVSVLVPTERFAVVEADVTATLVVGDIGLYIDLTDASTMNRAASTTDIGLVVGFISTTKGLVSLRIGGAL